jgi:hypothetical protein
MINFDKKTYSTISILLDEGFSNNQIVNFLLEKQKTATKKTPAQEKKFNKVMKEFKNKTLKSHDKIVTDYKTALAIAFSEAGLTKEK